MADQLVAIDGPVGDEVAVAMCQGLERQDRKGFSKERDPAFVVRDSSCGGGSSEGKVKNLKKRKSRMNIKRYKAGYQESEPGDLKKGQYPH